MVHQVAVVAFCLSDFGSMAHLTTELFQHGDIVFPVCVCSDLDPAVVVPKDSEVMLRGEDLTATCNALSSLKTSTVWYKVRAHRSRLD